MSALNPRTLTYSTHSFPGHKNTSHNPKLFLAINPEWAWECRHHVKTSCAYYSRIMYVVYKFTIPWHPIISTVIRFIHQHTYDIAARIPYIRSTCSHLTIDHFRIRNQEPLTSHTCIEILCQVAHFVVITQLNAILLSKVAVWKCTIDNMHMSRQWHQHNLWNAHKNHLT